MLLSNCAQVPFEETNTHYSVPVCMRLWSLHPGYLDAKGLVAVWREGLLAQKVLIGATQGYQYHPQLTRFRNQQNPSVAIAIYLREVWLEAERRGYRFDGSKIGSISHGVRIPVTSGQLRYELQHLRKKLMSRDLAALQRIATVSDPEPHPLFEITAGDIESWEVLR